MLREGNTPSLPRVQYYDESIKYTYNILDPLGSFEARWIGICNTLQWTALSQLVLVNGAQKSRFLWDLATWPAAIYLQLYESVI